MGHGGILRHKYLRHKTKKQVLFRFLLVFLVCFLYFLFVSYRYGFGNGSLITLLTWSFFVFCTPIADAGFLIDFPIRLILNVKMFSVEVGVWIVSAVLNLYALFYQPAVYSSTFILTLFMEILVTPFPYWSIIILSGIGTFFSVYFGDEMLDVVNHSERKNFQKHHFKHKLVIVLSIIFLIVSLYYYLINHLGIKF